MVEVASAAIAALFGLIFAMSTFERWLAKRRRHELAWSISLSMFATAAFALALGAQMGWNPVVFKTFFLFGAILNVPYLALGTVYLHFGQRIGDKVAAAVVLFSFLALGIMVATPLTHPLPLHQLAQGSKVFGPLPRIFAGVGSGLGAIVVFAGAALSFLRTNTGRFRISNALIAIGTAITGASGLLNSVFGAMTAFAVTLVIGIAVIYFGFVAATTATPQPKAPAAGSQSMPN
ncbi:MAG: hypothetical protein M0Z91_11195 [Actinomycetota bacterium]|nr:hypothetical protein [Actinomycetota bacterium]